MSKVTDAALSGEVPDLEQEKELAEPVKDGETEVKSGEKAVGTKNEEDDDLSTELEEIDDVAF